ncbi:MAG: hypothetical protein V4844_02150 [Pseudomonadota bacterium]
MSTLSLTRLFTQRAYGEMAEPLGRETSTEGEGEVEDSPVRAVDASPDALREFGVRLHAWDDLPRGDAMIAAVAHRSYRELTAEDLARKVIRNGCFVDVKSVCDRQALEACGLHVWRL